MKVETKGHQHVKHTCIHALAMLLLCVNFEAFAEDWTSINKAKDLEVLVDMDSYNESGGQPYITSKTIFNKPQNYRNNQKVFAYFESRITRQFNCALHTVKNANNNFYGLKHTLVGSEKGSLNFEPVILGSTIASIENLVCQVHKMVGGQ